MIMKAIKFEVLCVFLLCCNVFKGQTPPGSVSFPTPEIAAFNRRIETPVSYYTGVPQISISLCEVKMKGLDIPIVLNYHAGGIRVDQEATWVGLGWDLDFGGQITRQVRGMSDEEYFIPASIGANNYTTIKKFLTLPNSRQDPFLIARTREVYDAKKAFPGMPKDFMPDEFYYSALGFSGKFMYNQENKKFVLFPQEDIKVDFAGKQNLFNVMLPNGVSIDFGKDAGCSISDPFHSDFAPVRNNWLINVVRNGFNDSVVYSYEKFTYQMPKLSGQDYRISTGQDVDEANHLKGDTYFSNLAYKDALLTSIVFPSGRIDFTTSGREDMPGKALKTIEVRDKKLNLVKKIVFYYSYFNGNFFDIDEGRVYKVFPYNYPDNYKFKRMRLDSLSIEGSRDINAIKYRFDYYTYAQMPSKYSFSQDHWGFFNGLSNGSLIPAVSYNYNINPSLYSAGNRSVRPAKSNVFSLRSIIWPEGGKTEYEYENNDCNTENLPSIPRYLLNLMGDDNLMLKTAELTVSGGMRSSYSPSPNYVNNSTQTRYFTQCFTVGNNSFFDLANGWYCWTDFNKRSSIDNTFEVPFVQSNVEFSLNKINSNGSKKLIKSFNNTEYDRPYLRVNENQAPIYLEPGEYEMTIAITYLGAPFLGTEYDNQPHSTRFKISWRENENTTIYMGGLRIKAIRFFSNSTDLVKSKAYSYTHPLNKKSSGHFISLPLYIQEKLKLSNRMLYFYKYFTANSILPLTTTGGSYCGYEHVTEDDVDVIKPVNTIKTRYEFSVSVPYFLDFYGGHTIGRYLTEPDSWARGKLLSKKYYKGSSIIKQEDYAYYYRSPHVKLQTEEEYVDEINTNNISFIALKGDLNPDALPADFYDLTPAYDGGLAVAHFFNVDDFMVDRSLYDNTIYSTYPLPYQVYLPYSKRYTGFDKLKTKTITTTDDNGISLTSVENYYYDKTPALHQITQIKTNSSKKDEMTTKMEYPTDYSTLPPYNSMLQRHMLNPVIKQTSYKNTSFLQSTQTDYQDWGNDIIAPKKVQQVRGSGSANVITTSMLGYDKTGNLLSIAKENDAIMCYLWGYNSQYPVAKVIGSDYNTVKEKITQSILDNPTSDQALRDELNKLRSISSTLITTYTYAPLIGMTSETDPSGKTTYYEYDGFGRLKLIRDNNKNIIKEFDYKYNNQ